MDAATAIMLTVMIITPAGKQNIIHREEMPDLKTCWSEAQRFVDHDIPEGVEAEGLFAGCRRPVPKAEQTHG